MAARIGALIAVETFLVPRKGPDLRYNHENVLGRARLITELQPIFAKNAQEIRTFIVGHTLRIEYVSAGKAETLSLALDDRDVELLRRECDRATEKSATVRRQLSVCVFTDNRARMTEGPDSARNGAGSSCGPPLDPRHLFTLPEKREAVVAGDISDSDRAVVRTMEALFPERDGRGGAMAWGSGKRPDV